MNETTPDTDGSAETGRGTPRRRRRSAPRAVHHLLQLCFSCILALVILGAVVAAVASAGVNAPSWVRDHISTRLGAMVPGHAFEFGSLSVRLAEDLGPRVALGDVAVIGPDGARLASLARLDVTLATVPLVTGKLRPVRVHLSGARVLVRRRASGALSVMFDGVQQGGAESRSFPQQIEALFAQPGVASLDSVSADSLSLRYEDARAGRAWSADGGRVDLTRDGQEIRLRGDVALLGARDYATTLEVNYTGRIGQSAAEFGVKFDDMPAGDIALQSPALAWLSALEAPISGALRASVDGQGNLGPLNATLQIGEGALQPTPATRPIRFRSARSYFTYAPETQQLQFSEFSIDSAWGRLRAEGIARLIGVESGWPSELQAQIRLDEIVADPAGLYPEPVQFEGADMTMRLRLDPFVLTLGELNLSDRGQVLNLRGEARGRSDGWDISVKGGMASVEAERLLSLWPRTLKPKTRRWIDENVRRVDLSDVKFALRQRPGAVPEAYLAFDFNDLESVYVRDVPPVTGAAGHAELFDNRFVLHLTRGHVVALEGGQIDVAGSSFVIPDVRIKQSPARADLQAAGPITAALSLLDSPPFRFLEKAGQPVTMAEGRARVGGALHFLLKERLTPKEVAFEVNGTLRDMRSAALVKGRLLQAERLALEASNRHIEIGGQARVGAVPVNGSWDMEIGPQAQGSSRVRGQIEISGRFLEEFGIDLPPGSLSGRGRADLSVDFARGRPGRFTLNSDLAGVGLRLPQLNWNLPETRTGELQVSGRLGAPPQVDDIRLAGAGLAARGAVSLAPDGGLERASFSQVAIGDWFDASVALIGRGAGVPPAIEVTGGQIDLRRATLGESGGGGGAGAPLALRLDRLQISDGLALTGFRADLDTGGGLTGDFSGRLNGAAPITGDVVPTDGRSAFRIRSGDAGGVLAAAGLLQRARQGALELFLTPAPAPGSYDGRLKIAQLRVEEAPALAALLNTISVVGLLEQFSGQGLYFSEIDARFRLTPERLVLLAGSAVGASVGISMDGYYVMDSRDMDMQGVISPVYVLNGIGEAFTRTGEGVIGFNYTLTGPASDPTVSVNPLSALAPGFLREIFRRPAPQVEGATGQSRPAPDDPEPETAPYDRIDR